MIENLESWEIYLGVAAFLPVWYASTFLHEVGHAAMAWACGFRVSSFGMGLLQPWWVGQCWQARVFFCRCQPFQGVTFFLRPQLFPPRSRTVGVLVGGILANALLTAIALVLWVLLPKLRLLWLIVLFVNGAMSVGNAFPFFYQKGGLAIWSDGGQVLRLLFLGESEATAPLIVKTLEGLGPLWKAIGDSRTLHLYLLAASEAWTNLGDVAEGDRLCAEAEALGSPPGSLNGALQALVRADSAASRGSLDAARQAVEEAETKFRVLNDPHGLILVALSRVGLLIRENETVAALGMLESMVGDPAVRAVALLRRAIRLQLLRVCAALGSGEKVEGLRLELESGRHGCLTHAQTLELYLLLGRFHEQQNDGQRAASAYRQLLAAGQEIYGEWHSPENRKRFNNCTAPLQEEARAALHRLRPLDEPLAADFAQGYDEKQRLKDSARQARTLRTMRRRCVMAFLNPCALFAIGMLFLAVSVSAQGFHRSLVIIAAGLSLALALMSLVLAGVSVYIYWRGRHNPSEVEQRLLGVVVLFPWLLWVFGYVLAITDLVEKL